MGRGGPLEHPELRAVEKLLDDKDVAEAQRLLAQLGTRVELADGVAYLTTRLLYARGRLDLRGVADRLKDLILRTPDFPEAIELLGRADRGRLSAPPPPATAAPPATEPAANSSPPTPKIGSQGIPALPGARAPSDPVQRSLTPPEMLSAPRASAAGVAAPAGAPQVRKEALPTVPASPKAPKPRITDSPLPPRGSTPPQWKSSEPPASRPSAEWPLSQRSAKPSLGRNYTPLSGFDALSRKQAPPLSSEEPPARSAREVPDIPRAPALPIFRDNTAPPSYAPEGSSEAEAKRSKSLLPRNAGRYSETPGAPDIVDGAKPRPSRPPTRYSQHGIPAHRTRETVPITPEHIRSGFPPQSPTPLPTLFEIASWIDANRFKDAIAAINRAGAEAGPEYAVLRVRALAGAGYVDQAMDALEKLDSAPLIDPELRAACARLYVELGDPSRALLLAKKALDADPDRALIRLTYALASIRTARRRPDDGLLDQAERALEPLKGREGPLPALYQALKACIQAGSGDAEKAISIAQRALGLDPRSSDALAAIAEASARLGRAHDARQAWTRLAEVSPDESAALAGILAAAGVPVQARSISGASLAQDTPMWSSVELELASGHRGEALRVVEQAAHEAVRRIATAASKTELSPIANVAASFFTTASVLSSFAPFDLSLYSIARLEAAIDVLYGADRRPRLPTDDSAIVLLAGAYVGEALRLGFKGQWEGGTVDLDATRVQLGDRSAYPFRAVTARLHQGRRAKLSDALTEPLTRKTPEAWTLRIINPVSPPVPWAPHAWPRPSRMASIGRSLSRSPIGRYCEDFAEGPLDSTTASLIALDSYLELVAPREAPKDADSAWTRRLSVLAGSYVGETLRELVGGEWIYGVDAADDAHTFKLQLRGTVEAKPVAHVLERVIGERSSTLVDYAKTLMRRAARG